jgi:hypothetical protein
MDGCAGPAGCSAPLEGVGRLLAASWGLNGDRASPQPHGSDALRARHTYFALQANGNTI